MNNSKGTVSSLFFSVNKSLAVVIAQMLLNDHMCKLTTCCLSHQDTENISVNNCKVIET